ncbi:MAG: cupin domain-containing protein [Beijerinckiaceae bacterium]
MKATAVPEQFDLESFLAPIGSRQFFKEYWGSRFCCFRTAERERFSKLLTFADIETLLSDEDTPLERIGVAGKVQAPQLSPVSLQIYSTVDMVTRAYVNGRTIVLNGLQRRIKAIQTLAGCLECHFGSRIHANAYLTPANSQGFDPHYDTHDVFILQVAGSKCWKVGGQPIRFPLEEFPLQRADAETFRCSDDAAEFVLNKGDILYIPRGIVHEARATTDASLHLTIGNDPVTLLDLARAALCSAAVADEQLRRPIPPGVLTGDDGREFLGDAVRIITKAITQANYMSLLDEFRTDFIASKPQKMHGLFQAIHAADHVADDRIYRKRLGILTRTISDQERLTIIFSGKKIELPKFTLSAVDLCLSGNEFTIMDIPDLDSESSRVLVRRLLREGLLEDVSQ